jgi:hypothetical protein
MRRIIYLLAALFLWNDGACGQPIVEISVTPGKAGPVKQIKIYNNSKTTIYPIIEAPFPVLIT